MSRAPLANCPARRHDHQCRANPRSSTNRGTDLPEVPDSKAPDWIMHLKALFRACQVRPADHPGRVPFPSGVSAPGRQRLAGEFDSIAPGWRTSFARPAAEPGSAARNGELEGDPGARRNATARLERTLADGVPLPSPQCGLTPSTSVRTSAPCGRASGQRMTSAAADHHARSTVHSMPGRDL